MESEVYGREEDKAAIVELLLNVVGGLSVISIFGLGGLGKTTLAQFAFNNEKVEKHFELRIWICVSDNFDVKQIIKSIIECITKAKCDLPDIDSLQRCLREKLNDKRFVLVLDDVWSDDQWKWENLKKLLICGSVGSKVIVTTRSEKVAKIMGANATDVLYRLKGLSENDCWTLFKERAFAGREEHPDLVTIGKEIVKKCGGLPLAAKALGSSMWFKTEEREWLSVRESELWHLHEDENVILPSLKLSYNHMSPHLRQCFAYCSIFPKDYKIRKEKLIQLWMANNFIPSEEGMELEDIGHNIFKELLWRGFFQDMEKDDDGSIIKCKMHDLVHDLARYVMGNEFISVEVGLGAKDPKRIRHLSLTCDIYEVSSINKALLGLQNLHTFYVLLDHFGYYRIPPYISKYKCLRVLDLRRSYVKELPISVKNLKHLRYLNLSYTKIEVLPETLSSLFNLQTLKLRSCYKLCMLPSGMRNMVGLRHLDIRCCYSLNEIPTRIGQLSCLKTLTDFIVSDNNGRRIGELHSLNLIRGKLLIKGLENVRNGMDAKEANLIGKKDLRELALLWTFIYYDTNSPENNAKDVAEGLRPHRNIRRLAIEGYPDIEFPYWMRDSSLSNLVEINLSDCKRCQSLPPLGQLPFLKFLCINRLSDVRCVGNEFYGGDDIAKGFPSLEVLKFEIMSNLEEWWTAKGREVFPILCKLDICCCQKLTRITPQFSSLKKLSLGESNLMLSRFVANLTSLSSLDIYQFQEVSLPKDMLRNLTQLQSLKIRRFPELRSLSRELDNLTALKHLSINACEKLESLPQESLQNLTSLESLKIVDCHSLTSLLGEEAIQGLSSLRILYIQECDKLASLPDGLQYLTALQELDISKCPNLDKRCKKETGKDWHKIAHIPHIRINDQDVNMEPS